MTANRPEAVPLLYKYVLGELEHTQNQFDVPALEANREKLLLTRKFRDAFFKACLMGGIPKVYPLASISTSQLTFARR
jgi:hypothetical protein